MARSRGDRWPGMGKRIRQRLMDLGYRKERAQNEPDLVGFARERRVPQMNIYRWAGESAITRKSADKLAKQLGVTLGWLLLGEPVRKFPKRPRRPVIASGAAAMLALPAHQQQDATATGSVPGEGGATQVQVPEKVDELLLIRRRAGTLRVFAHLAGRRAA